jgi:tRNA(Ile)-lysidine synthase
MSHPVELEVRRAAAALLPRGSPVLVAVSGGGDSMALLHLLHGMTRSHGLSLRVAHLDHGLRRGSRTDRRFVEEIARGLGLPCSADRREVATLRRKDESPEEAARRVRRAFLIECARQAGCRWIATGHTLDDQAETVLMRLVRGAGATALTGMAVSGPGPFVRPLLEVERDELRTWLSRRRLSFRDDPTNRDLRFDRNRVRRLALPFLADLLNRRAARHLVGAARRFREDAEYLDGVARRALCDCATRPTSDRLVLDAHRLCALAPVLGQRVARLALQQAGADARRIGTRHIETVLDLARGGSGRRAHLPGGMTARRDRTRLFLEKN